MKKLILIACCFSAFCQAGNVDFNNIGMTIEIRKEIFEKAETLFPDSYSARNYYVEKECKAFAEYHFLKKEFLK